MDESTSTGEDGYIVTRLSGSRVRSFEVPVNIETVEVSPADNGSTSSSTLTVCGLYTVPYGGLLTLELEAVDLTPLTASLQRDGADPITITLTEEGLTSGISIQPPTDEAVNGDWTLTLRHSGEGPSATLHGWSVYFESWPD